MNDLFLSNGTRVPTTAPFFITGSGRCGTTLMRRLLLQTASVAIPPENYTMAQTARIMERAGYDWADFCKEIVAYHQSNADAWNTYRLDADEWLSELLAVSPKYKTSEAVWHIYHALWALKNGVDYDTWGDKTPRNAFFLHRINALFPQGRYIFMVRDGYDTALSYAEHRLNGANLIGAAKRWVEANELIVDFITRKPKGTTLIVRYEDLVTKTDEAVDRCLRFIGLRRISPRDPTEMMYDAKVWQHLNNATKPVFTNSVGRWRSDADKVGQIADIVEPMRQKFGYAAIEE